MSPHRRDMPALRSLSAYAAMMLHCLAAAAWPLLAAAHHAQLVSKAARMWDVGAKLLYSRTTQLLKQQT